MFENQKSSRSLPMITLQEYKNSREEYQMFILKHRGVRVSTLRRGNEVYTLFQLYGFYVEACSYGTVGPMCLINCFEETELLEPYLKSINISSVYKILNQEK
jgi:hypothetical protein